MPRHFLINITWKCQLDCSYCWVRRHINKTPALDAVQDRPLEDWLRAARRDTPDMLVLGGGEPLSIPWTLDLIRALPNVGFCLNTNGLDVERVEELARSKLRNVWDINLSYHPEAALKYDWYNAVWKRDVVLLQTAGYPVRPNLMKTPLGMREGKWAIDWLQDRGLHMLISPMCGGLVQSHRLQEQGLLCEAGINHITIAPDGMAWPCLSALWSDWWMDTSLGNWLDGPLDLSRKPVPCHLYCAEYHVQYEQHESGDFWNTKVRPA